MATNTPSPPPPPPPPQLQLALSGVPTSTLVGVAATGSVVSSNTSTKAIDWMLSAQPPGLTISPSSGTLDPTNPTEAITLTPQAATQFTITLTDTSGSGAQVMGSGVVTTATGDPVPRYLALLADLETLF